MEIVIAAAFLAVGLVAAALLMRRAARAARAGSNGGSPLPPTAAPAPPVPADREAIDAELRERRAEIARIEERILTKEEALDAKLTDLSRREQVLTDRARELDKERELLAQRKREHVRELERVASLSASQAKQVLLKQVEEEARHDSARLVRQVEEETKRDAERRVRSILSVVMQRLAAGHAAETTVSVVQLPSDDMKGRIIGRDGRNIRAPEHLTGADFIPDDTPNAHTLTGAERVPRANARPT